MATNVIGGTTWSTPTVPNYYPSRMLTRHRSSHHGLEMTVTAWNLWRTYSTGIQTPVGSDRGLNPRKDLSRTDDIALFSITVCPLLPLPIRLLASLLGSIQSVDPDTPEQLPRPPRSIRHLLVVC